MNKKHITGERMCVICRKRDFKKNLVRFARNKDGLIFLDETKKSQGRGAYICNNKNCLNKAKKKRILNSVFKCKIDDDIYDGF